MNSAEFKHFKLHADSTLKSMTKDELVSYIHMLYHNWGVVDEGLCNGIDYSRKLDKALDEACEELEDFDITFNNADFENVRTKEQWKEELMKDVD